MTDQPAAPQSGAEENRITTIDGLKTEQTRQAGVLDRLLQLVEGGEHQAASTTGDVHAAGQQRVEDRLDRPSRIQDEIQQAIRAVQADQQHEADHARLRQPPAETTPREVMVKGKARLQRRMFGADT